MPPWAEQGSAYGETWHFPCWAKDGRGLTGSDTLCCVRIRHYTFTERLICRSMAIGSATYRLLPVDGCCVRVTSILIHSPRPNSRMYS